MNSKDAFVIASGILESLQRMNRQLESIDTQMRALYDVMTAGDRARTGRRSPASSPADPWSGEEFR